MQAARVAELESMACGLGFRVWVVVEVGCLGLRPLRVEGFCDLSGLRNNTSSSQNSNQTN